ncbi:unnamed protein product [Sphenostylis stenocarpa]|uniref:Uncharacterized protein n=1 Tax=Sphenostylis stenocarpa TaxID=92480 RepID=A0AA86SP74_9FABA|nr:unnamed protein product [Sphenostylis stenocarpa]
MATMSKSLDQETLHQEYLLCKFVLEHREPIEDAHVGLFLAVTVPSFESESHASSSRNIVDSLKNILVILYQFMYPYAMCGRSIAAISASLIAVEKLSDISPLFFIGLLQLAKNIGTETFVFKRPVVFPRSLIVSIIFMTFYSLGLALSKDIPDIEGDKKFGVDSFSARLGSKKVFWICVGLYEMAFGVAILAGASSSSPFWIKIVTGVGNLVLALTLWYQTKYVDVTNPASARSFYSLNWKSDLAATIH